MLKIGKVSEKCYKNFKDDKLIFNIFSRIYTIIYESWQFYHFIYLLHYLWLIESTHTY